MEVLLLGIAIVFSIILISGWVILLFTPLVLLSIVVVGDLVKGVSRFHHFLPGLAKNIEEGILCIDGLASVPSLAKRVRSDIARVLDFAPQGTNPRACACVLQVDGSTIGVMRIFNTKGHYLLRVSCDTITAVADHFSATLEEFRDTFPAKAGARRIQCPECNPKTCPLRKLKRHQASA